MNKFDIKRYGTGTKEWAETTFNIQVGCSNGCRYCYAADKAAKMYGGWCKRDEWTIERLTKNAEIKSYPARDGVIMFPSTHDITPFNVDAYIRVALLMLAKGNNLLIVSKPRMECILKMLPVFKQYRDQILFRFTIGAISSSITNFWEPGAPQPQERIDCLSLAHHAGFSTSVSIEPMLGGIVETLAVVQTVNDIITDTIWIGKMNKIRTRVDQQYGSEIFTIEYVQRDERIMEVVAELQGNPKVRWKDSINEVIARQSDR